MKVNKGLKVTGYYPQKGRSFYALFNTKPKRKRVLKLADGKMKGSAFTGFTFKPDFAIVIFHNLFADGQTNSGSVVLVLVVQTFEHLENSFRELFGYAYTVIMHREGVIIKRIGPEYIDFRFGAFIEL